ncbi:MAG: ROK family protein [Planctomycetota bacterium]
MTRHAIGVDLGGTKIKACLVTGDGEIVARETRPTVDDGGRGWVSAVAATVEALSLGHEDRPAVGLAAPGIASSDGRSIAVMPGRLAGLERFDWSEAVGTPVAVLNDAHAFVAGEAWLGAARDEATVVGLTLGTGVGGGVLIDGRPFVGRDGRAGHLGHISLDPEGGLDITNTPGSLEDAIGEHSLSSRSGGRFATTADLVEAVRTADGQATEVWSRSVRALAAAVASLINIFSPESVVIGGGIASAGETLFEPLRTRLDEIEWRPFGRVTPVRPAELGTWAGAVGAAREAMRKNLKSSGGEP